MLRFQILLDDNHKEDQYNVVLSLRLVLSPRLVLNLALNKHLITSRLNNQLDNPGLGQDQLLQLQDQLREEMLYKI